MISHGVTFDTLAQGQVVELLARPSGKPVTALTRNGYRYLVRRYLEWLHARRLIHFNPAWLRVRRKVLAEPAEKFLASLAPATRVNAIVAVRVYLRKQTTGPDWTHLTTEALGTIF